METNPKMTLMLKLTDKNFTAAYFYAQRHRNVLVMNEKVRNLREVETIHKKF